MSHDFLDQIALNEDREVGRIEHELAPLLTTVLVIQSRAIHAEREQFRQLSAAAIRYTSNQKGGTQPAAFPLVLTLSVPAYHSSHVKVQPKRLHKLEHSNARESEGI